MACRHNICVCVNSKGPYHCLYAGKSLQLQADSRGHWPCFSGVQSSSHTTRPSPRGELRSTNMFYCQQTGSGVVASYCIFWTQHRPTGDLNTDQNRLSNLDQLFHDATLHYISVRLRDYNDKPPVMHVSPISRLQKELHLPFGTSLTCASFLGNIQSMFQYKLETLSLDLINSGGKNVFCWLTLTLNLNV